MVETLTAVAIATVLVSGALAAPSPALEVGIAVRDITPELPIRLAGYASRNRPADKADHPLLLQALALRNPSGERFVFVALDNCEVSSGFMQPVIEETTKQFQLARGAVAVVSSHTHSGPVLEATLADMTQPPPEDRSRIEKYSDVLRTRIVEAVGAALKDCRPATLERGLGRATFAMNRRVYQGDKVVFGDNPDGPVDWDVPVLRIKGTNGAVRAIVFGYACHGTSVRTGDDWYVVSGEYMAYAREHLEKHEPGAVAMFLTGMGADSDPAPRGQLIHAKRHGLELAGAVMGVLDRPMQPVSGPFQFAYEDIELPLATPPTREQLEKDTASEDQHVKARARAYLKLLNSGKPLPTGVELPIAVLRLGGNLSFILVGGEVVVDYSRRIKRILKEEHPWPVGYAYHVPCYIPSARLVKEGGYETESSMVYYGYYGPFRGEAETTLLGRIEGINVRLRAQP